MKRRNRRKDQRFELDRPVKIQCTQTGRYYGGRVVDLSPSGALVVLTNPSLMVPGQRVKLGIAWTSRQVVLDRAEMSEATVVRSLGRGSGQKVALFFDQRQDLKLAG